MAIGHMAPQAYPEGHHYMPPESFDSFAEPKGGDAEAIDKLFEVVSAFREVHPKMPTSYAVTFLAVARKPGLGPTEYAKMIGAIQPIASRILLEIGIRSKGREGGEGLGLVDRKVDIHNLRAQQYYLTPDGRVLLNKLIGIIQGRKSNSQKAM